MLRTTLLFNHASDNRHTLPYQEYGQHTPTINYLIVESLYLIVESLYIYAKFLSTLIHAVERPSFSAASRRLGGTKYDVEIYGCIGF